MVDRLYLIDGVRVTRKVYWRRQMFGEYPGADFRIVEVRRQHAV